MQYMTIVLELIQSQPVLHQELKQSGRLLMTMQRQALQLKSLHQAWMDQLRQTSAGIDPAQIRFDALELALIDLLSADLQSADLRSAELRSADLQSAHSHSPAESNPSAATSTAD